MSLEPSLRRSDARLLLPALPRTAAVLGLRGWAESLEATGAEVAPPRRALDLVVTASQGLAEALAAEPTAIITEGRRTSRSLRRAGYHASTWLPLPAPVAWEALLPLESPRAADFALTTWRPPVDPRRSLAGRALVVARQAPPRRSVVTVASRSPDPSVVVAAAAEATPTVPRDAAIFFAAPGVGDGGRLVAYAFPPKTSLPAAVVKIARRQRDNRAFDADERGLAIASGAGAVVGRHAPKLLARFEIAERAASVETVAPGRPLSSWLRQDPDRARPIVDMVARWIVEIGSATAHERSALDGPRARLAHEVLRSVPEDTTDVEDAMARVPAVVAHDDIGSWNVLATTDDFGVVDWESAKPSWFPLWDLCYFLADALALVDGARTVEDRAAGMLALFRGTAPSSPHLLRWVRIAVEALDIAEDDVGPLVLGCWLHHAASAAARDHRDGVIWPAERVAAGWLSDQSLRREWRAWA